MHGNALSGHPGAYKEGFVAILDSLLDGQILGDRPSLLQNFGPCSRVKGAISRDWNGFVCVH